MSSPSLSSSGERRPVIGLALGSGSARGWAHLGVLQALAQAGIHPGVVCGTSIGALVGAAHVLGRSQALTDWVLGLKQSDVLSFVDVSWSGGLLKGERLMAFLRSQAPERNIETLSTPFATVATALHTGQEVWLRQGSTLDAVRASIALPGLFTPVWHEGRLLVDGGLVNPVPVSLARALGADVVIAVDLNADLLTRHERLPAHSQVEDSGWLGELRQRVGWPPPPPSQPPLPSVLDTLAASIHIMQMRITRSRMGGDPPELTIAPRLAHLGLMDFHRAAEAIAEGQRAATEGIAHLQRLVPL